MKQGIYAIYDRIAEESGPVWAARNDAVAVRNAQYQLRNARADEYRLYCLGSYDSEAVAIKALDVTREVVLSQVVEITAGTAVQGSTEEKSGRARSPEE